MIYTQFPRFVRWAFLVLLVGLAAFIFVQSLTAVRVSFNAHNTDKIIHFAAYFILAGVSLPAFPKQRAIIVLLCVAGFGGLIEILQGTAATGRSADIWDFIANSAGAVCALAVWWILSVIWRRIRH